MFINKIKSYLGKEFILQGWMYNKRSSGKIAFLQLRDGTGFIQGIVDQAKVSKEVWKAAEEITIESSCVVVGTVTKHPKKDEYELQVSDLKVVQLAPEFPIGNSGAS